MCNTSNTYYWQYVERVYATQGGALEVGHVMILPCWFIWNMKSNNTVRDLPNAVLLQGREMRRWSFLNTRVNSWPWYYCPWFVIRREVRSLTSQGEQMVTERCQTHKIGQCSPLLSATTTSICLLWSPVSTVSLADSLSGSGEIRGLPKEKALPQRKSPSAMCTPHIVVLASWRTAQRPCPSTPSTSTLLI